MANRKKKATGAAPRGKYTTLDVVAREGVRLIGLARPEVHNAFNETLIAELTDAVREAGADPAVRVLLLHATGSSFCAGADLEWMKRMAAYGHAENLADANALAGMLSTLAQCPKPTVACVNGAAYGGGVGLIACCDIAIGVDSARFGLTETRLGLVPAVISPYVIDAIGARQARRLFLTAELFDAHEAARIGLLHRGVEFGGRH
ncbi:MAG TPA: enoyl-CoA hydratase-related protein, partial [Casimicrobiaceae bacterium]|nr:enoyl-CoA hydratase-related protein [Casimicrobiaceae bacterium]